MLYGPEQHVSGGIQHQTTHYHGAGTVRVALLGWLVAGAALAGCRSDSTEPIEPRIAAYRDRMIAQQAEPSAPPAPARPPVARPVAAQAALPEKTALLTQPAVASQPALEQLLAEFPDPSEAPQVFEKRLADLREEYAGRPDQRVVRNYERVVAQANEYLKMLPRPKQVRLSLAECVQRALEHNYTVRIEAYGPAISETQIVEAEAAFDTQFFLDASYANLDRAVIPGAYPAQSDTRALTGGLRKLLPTGMQASVGLGQRRYADALPKSAERWNPNWTSTFLAELRQPLLRGFGLDVNRAPINIRRAEYDISQEQFLQRVRDTLLTVEAAYWQLAQARRNAAIIAEIVAQNFATYQNMLERLGHDATQVEVENAKSQWQTQYVVFLETVKNVRDAEDRLRNLINDPRLKLSDDVEIIPTEVPYVAPTVLDQFAEVRTALDRRAEIRAARRRIEAARISTAAAKNAVLPQLDVAFQYEVEGLERTADDSFDRLTTNRNISFTVSAQFVYALGERAGRAAYQRARLLEAQAVVALNQICDSVVEEVNTAVRTLMVRYEQLPPQYEAVRSADRQLRALQARTQRIDPTYLQTELSGVQQLANARTRLLGVVTDYNLALIELERAKGTLLDYNNVIVTDVRAGR